MKIREKIAQNLDLPREVLLGVSKIAILGNSSVQIENFKGVIEYDSAQIRIKTEEGALQILGADLEICEITDENIQIKGVIKQICL